MFLSYRSAKSVAWRRLNVVGVSSPFFLPLEVISRTICEEFHSVVKTGSPLPLSHLEQVELGRFAASVYTLDYDEFSCNLEFLRRPRFRTLHLLKSSPMTRFQVRVSAMRPE